MAAHHRWGGLVVLNSVAYLQAFRLDWIGPHVWPFVGNGLPW